MCQNKPDILPFKVEVFKVAFLFSAADQSHLSRLALKIVVMTREQGTLNWEQGTGERFWATLLFVTYFGCFPFTYLGVGFLLYCL